jgi:Arc/MetJ-type ribon-helix-helix transcriptional regulator
MTITLRPETEAKIAEKIRLGEFDSADAIVEQAVASFLDEEEEEMDDAEFSMVKAAVGEGLRQAAMGEGISLQDFDQAMRRKYAISR